MNIPVEFRLYLNGNVREVEQFQTDENHFRQL